MSASSDESLFEDIYRSIPAGLTITAARSDHSETLRSFCFSLKGAAIRLGSNAMFFRSQYSRRNWLDKGLHHFRSFIEKHAANGIRLFLIDQPTGYADREVANALRELADSMGVSVILTAIAYDNEQNTAKWVAALEGGAIVFCFAPSISLRGRSARQFSSKPIEIEGPAGERAVLRVTHVTNVLEHDFYHATAVFAGGENQYGPLYFLDVCPQPPDSQSQGRKTET